MCVIQLTVHQQHATYFNKTLFYIVPKLLSAIFKI